MKIHKYVPPDSLKAEVMKKITDDSYVDELLSLPETSSKKTRVIPLLSAAAAVVLVIGASVYLLGHGGIKNDEGTSVDEEANIGSTEDFSDPEEYGDMIESDGSLMDSASDNAFVSNDNAFIPEDDADRGENYSGSTQVIPATVTANGNTVTLSASDSAEISKLLIGGEYIDLDCSCTPRYTIRIGEQQYTVHKECANIAHGSRMLTGISIQSLDEIVNKYIN